MLFKYTPEITKETAKQLAQLGRAMLVRSLIDKYKKITAMNSVATPELTRFLSCFLRQIETMNDCKNQTNQFVSQLQGNLKALEDHTNYLEIKELFDQSVVEIQRESRNSKDRERYAAKNKLATIKNHAVYLATPSSLTVIAAGILAIFYPVGFLALAAAAVVLIASEVIFLIRNYQDYQQIKVQIKDDLLGADYAEGMAVPYSELPIQPSNSQKQEKEQSSPEERPVLISENADRLLNNLFEAGTEIAELGTDMVTDAATAAYTTASQSVVGIWSIFKGIQPVPSNLASDNHLHTL